jgi:DNA-directed RNA polymerase subunit alpha
MDQILLPSKMNFTPGTVENETILTVEPLYYGYGVTMGNTLRRVLLSSLEGAAVTAMKLKGAQHEFSTVEGVKEDVLEVIMNLKKLRMRVHTNEPVVLTIDVSKRVGEVTGADIQANADVEIINKDLVLATVTDAKVPFHLEITVRKGRGFLPTEKMDTTQHEIGLIAMDALFSPIVRVGMKVENTRVGEITNFDKLVMNIQTDGTISAEGAVAAATKIISDHYNWIAGNVSSSGSQE